MASTDLLKQNYLKELNFKEIIEIITLNHLSERLFVIRANIKQFLNKWGRKRRKNTSELRVATIGGILLLVDKYVPDKPLALIGGIIAFDDAEEFLDDFHELLGISKRIEISKFGKTNKTFGDLQNQLKKFLQDYDQDNNGSVDVEELIAKRKLLSEDLSKEKDASQLGRIVIILQKLEEELINYYQSSSEEGNK
ncbi:12630_t:CDS:2 [Racocetra persica]|uniref:12630_t:CDS:1 n=1 Tax=Racocetra persica TaxID=160502 RepID=A0ACA9LHH3_9GLOM|nr:12630_t:CDS:2 [Racocetra persica]